MSKSYFSLVQYCPDLPRQEAVNVGVVLLCPEQNFVGSKMVPGNNRVRRFFGENADGIQHLNAMKNALASRICLEATELLTLEAFETFVQSRGNKVVLTSPKPLRGSNPEADLAALYEELVQEPKKALSVQASKPLRQRLDEAFEDNRLQPFLRQHLCVDVPAMKKQLKVPYGYKNGRFNLIQPVEFTQKTSNAVERAACVQAVEGHSIYKNPDSILGELQLVIVAEIPRAEIISVVRDMFTENQVRLVTSDELGDLANEIVNHGKPLTGE